MSIHTHFIQDHVIGVIQLSSIIHLTHILLANG